MKRIFFALLLLAVASCGEDDAAQPVGLAEITSVGSTTQATTVCYILCDFSASQGNNSRQTIIQNANKIFKAGVGLGYRLYYYDIRSLHFQGPFFGYKAAGESLMSQSKRKQLQDSIKVQGDTLNERMMRLCQPPYPKNTCIIMALNKVANAIGSDTANNKIPFKVVILSDMLEDCIYDSVRVNIEKGNYKKALDNLSRISKSRFTFARNNIEVSIVASSERDISNYNLFFEFWKQVFAKYDYELKTAISTNLPAWADR